MATFEAKNGTTFKTDTDTVFESETVLIKNRDGIVIQVNMEDLREFFVFAKDQDEEY